LDRIAQRYGELEDALATLESLAHQYFPQREADPAPEQISDEAPLPRKPR
jgi:hypothetical protein